MNIPSKLVERAVEEIAKLPSIGKKTALRLALHLLKQPVEYSVSLAEALVKLRTDINYCAQCHNISDASICSICDDKNRDFSLICVVEDTPDVLAIENTSQYRGLYHVLGGVISPMSGVSPSDLYIETLITRISQAQTPVKEVVFALSATMEGDTTVFYMSKKLKYLGVSLSTLSRGVAVGSELEYTDEITLGRSITQRIKYE